MNHTQDVRGLVRFCAPCLGLLFAVACDDGAPPDASSRFGAIIEGGGVVAPFADYESTSAEPGFSETVGDEAYWCSRTTHDVIAGFDTFPLFDTSSELAFPGNLLQGATLDWRSPQPIPVARAGGSIAVTLAGTESAVARTLPIISRNWVVQAARDLIAKVGPERVARTTWTTSRVTSREQLGLALHTPLENLAPEIRTAFAYKSSVAYQRILVTLTQSYYTIEFDPPADTAALFAPEVTPDELAPHVRPGNPATYVSSVTYGRVYYLLLQSASPYEDMEAAVDASLRAVVSGEPMAANAIHLGELEDLRVGGYALGADGAKACQAAQAGIGELTRVIAEGARLSVGAPISFVVRNLARPEELVRAKVAVSFEAVECLPQ